MSQRRHGRARWLREAAVVGLLAVMVGCGDAGDADREILVFAAASLADVMSAVEHEWTAAGGEPVRFNFAGSNELARQVLAGAPAEIFVSADRAQVERLIEAGSLRPEDVTELLANVLVVIGSGDRRAEPLRSPSELLSFERLALADPAAVPAGVYARGWLEAIGLWHELEERVVPTLDVRAALQAVASGEIEAGIVYATDVDAPGAAGRVSVLWRVPPDDPAAPPIRYYACWLGARGAEEPFARFLAGPRAAAIFAAAGFRPLAAEPPS